MSRIVRLQAENFKRLKAVDITPDANTVVIAGRNAQGKSSVLDAIMAALAGRAGSKDLVRPVRDGETKATVTVTLEDLEVTRKWTPSGSEVVVKPVGGAAKLNSPQKVLDALIGKLSFDPLAFAEAEPKAQVESLIDLVGREQFDKIAQARRAAYDARTEANREAKSVKARLEALPTSTDEALERIDAAALSREYGVARERIALRERWEKLKAEMAEIEARVQSLPASRPVEEVDDLLSRATEINHAVDIGEQREALSDEFYTAQGEAADLSEQIATLDVERADLIAKSALPVPGLGFDDDGVTLNGVPFVQSSAAERLKVSVAMAMALNPALRVICIRDASLLDAESKHALVALAKAHDYQIWFEVVGDGGQVGIVIEDGAVQA